MKYVICTFHLTDKACWNDWTFIFWMRSTFLPYVCQPIQHESGQDQSGFETLPQSCSISRCTGLIQGIMSTVLRYWTPDPASHSKHPPMYPTQIYIPVHRICQDTFPDLKWLMGFILWNNLCYNSGITCVITWPFYSPDRFRLIAARFAQGCLTLTLTQIVGHHVKAIAHQCDVFL